MKRRIGKIREKLCELLQAEWEIYANETVKRLNSQPSRNQT